jgi:membrane-associated phospholipid phosphatase
LEVANWIALALGYATYLAAVSLTRHDFARARSRLCLVAAAGWVASASVGKTTLSPALLVVVPSLVLLAGYWLSGLLFVRPDVRLEQRLQRVDDWVLRGTGVLACYRRSPRVVQDFFELSYLLVYVAVPAGATTLVASGHGDHVSRFWSIVLLAEFACYGMLPWVQTRPPRATDVDGDTDAEGVRRLNLRLVNRASIQANTLPSGHAAGAFATALAVGSVLPSAGIVFLVLATSIAIATVLGRYHYVVDTVLGVLVALAAWSLLS